MQDPILSLWCLFKVGALSDRPARLYYSISPDVKEMTAKETGCSFFKWLYYTSSWDQKFSEKKIKKRNPFVHAVATVQFSQTVKKLWEVNFYFQNIGMQILSQHIPLSLVTESHFILMHKKLL